MAKERYAVVTFADHEQNGFAGLGRITEAQFRAAPVGPDDPNADHAFILDLWESDVVGWDVGVVDDKIVTKETAAAVLGWPVAEIVQRGRQAVAAAGDEFREIYRRTKRQ